MRAASRYWPNGMTTRRAATAASTTADAASGGRVSRTAATTIARAGPTGPTRLRPRTDRLDDPATPARARSRDAARWSAVATDEGAGVPRSRRMPRAAATMAAASSSSAGAARRRPSMATARGMSVVAPRLRTPRVASRSPGAGTMSPTAAARTPSRVMITSPTPTPATSAGDPGCTLSIVSPSPRRAAGVTRSPM